MTLRNFELEIEKYLTEDVPQEANLLARAVGAEALRRLVYRTPVKTGRARGAWFVSVDDRNYDQALADAAGNPTRSDAQAMNEGIGVINGSKPFQSIILQNNVEYIEALEDGSSTQAPSGMLAVTAAELQAVFV